jgi:hypothetical protein
VGAVAQMLDPGSLPAGMLLTLVRALDYNGDALMAAENRLPGGLDHRHRR